MGRLPPPNRIRALRASRVYDTIKIRLANPRKDIIQQTKTKKGADEDEVEAAATTNLREEPPVWLKVLERYPPAEILTRPKPTPHRDPDPRRRVVSRNIFKPQRITYPEDELRRTFFRDHPWELARPRIAVELDGKDAQLVDWGRGLNQPGMQVTGESVVQRQLWLMENGQPEQFLNEATGDWETVTKPLTKAEAYDIARKELYLVRQAEDIRRRVAQEEARHVGAYFSLSRMELSTIFEDVQYNGWRAWAEEEAAKVQAVRDGAYANFGAEDVASDPAVVDALPEEDNGARAREAPAAQ